MAGEAAKYSAQYLGLVLTVPQVPAVPQPEPQAASADLAER